MSQISNLLSEKNEYLDKFYALNSAELVRILDGDFENLDTFYNARDCILNMINSVDKRINDLNRGLLTPEKLSVQDRKVVLRALDKKNDMVQQILSLDLQILSAIEDKKSSIIKELGQTRITKRAMGSYKSGKSRSKTSFDENV